MRILLTICSLFCALSVWSQQLQPTQLMAEGNRWFKEGQFEKAIPKYQEALKQADTLQAVRYNLGAAQFRTKAFEEAEKAFDETAEKSDNGLLKQKALYNKGVSLTRQKKLQESIEAYKAALRLDPTDTDTRINLQKALEELRQQQKKQEEPKKNPQQEKNQNKQQPPANKKMIEQWLQSLRQKEQEVQQKMLNKGRASKQPEKDW